MRSVDLLLVEDNTADVELIRLSFEEAGLDMATRLHVARDGQQALDFVRRSGTHTDAPRPDLILLDLNLPKKDGWQVLAELKSDPDIRSIPVVVLSSSIAEEDVTRSYQLLANGYIRKPYELDEFEEVVRVLGKFWLQVVRLPEKAATTQAMAAHSSRC